MSRYFPLCPICSSQIGYTNNVFRGEEVVKCKACGSEWGSRQLDSDEPLLILWKAPTDSRYTELLGQAKSVNFWKKQISVMRKERIFCMNCGAENNKGSKFCEKCGIRFEITPSSTQPQTNSKVAKNDNDAELLRILKIRYVRGEVTREQFEQMKKDLGIQ